MSNHSQRAMALFKEGYNCSQAVFAAFCEDLDIDFETALKIASSFGGGMGRLREVCGAVSGMFMVAGMKYGYDNPNDKKAKTKHYKRIQKLAEKFRTENSSIICRELLGLNKGPDSPVPETRTEEYYKKRPCMELVGYAAKIMEEMIQNKANREEYKMKIAVLSGKGGTGKTFVSVNLACVSDSAVYVDCDVEEPNGHLFLKPVITHRSPVKVKVPVVDISKCTGCRRCVDFCKYNALAYIKDKLLIFKELCHSCGGCCLICPSKALSEKEREIGIIEEGLSDQVVVLTGCLNTGEASGVPIIKGLIEKSPKEGTIIIDCPPGSACIVMESIRTADFCLLVAEPTVFGVHNMSMVYDLVKLFNKPFGVVLNKCLEEENPAERFCTDNEINILAKIPFDEELGRCISDGLIAVRENKKYRELFKELSRKLKKEVSS